MFVFHSLIISYKWLYKLRSSFAKSFRVSFVCSGELAKETILRRRMLIMSLATAPALRYSAFFSGLLLAPFFRRLRKRLRRG